MVKIITSLKRLIAKHRKATYYWAGYGENPLKHMGIEDFKR